jgi:hypothetical protein
MSNITINVQVEIPNSIYCNECKFRTPTISLYSEPKCLIFNNKLKYEILDKYLKCEECIRFMQQDD